MIKFDGLVIVVEPDYKERILKGIEFDELNCNAYDENDTEFKNSLLEFTLMPGKDDEYETVEDVETAIKRVVETEWPTIQLERANLELERTSEILGKAFGYLSEIQKGEDLYRTLKNQLGMTDKEIKDAEFEGLDEFFDESQNEGMNLS